MLAILLILLLAAGGIVFALLIDTDTSVNTFTTGDVAIELTEPSWTGPQVTRPGKSFRKDPQVTNTGRNSAVVFLEVLIPRADVRIYTEGEPDMLSSRTGRDLFTFEPGSDWLLLREEIYEEGESAWTRRVYGLKYELEPGNTTRPLFETVTFIPMVEGDLPMGTGIDIIVRACALQSGYADLSGTDPEILTIQLQSAFAAFEAEAAK